MLYIFVNKDKNNNNDNANKKTNHSSIWPSVLYVIFGLCYQRQLRQFMESIYCKTNYIHFHVIT